jgi:hypothetical protein
MRKTANGEAEVEDRTYVDGDDDNEDGDVE